MVGKGTRRGRKSPLGENSFEQKVGVKKDAEGERRTSDTFVSNGRAAMYDSLAKKKERKEGRT